VIFNYKWKLWGLSGEKAEEKTRQVHQSSAERLLRMCLANGYIYIKVGQHSMCK